MQIRTDGRNNQCIDIGNLRLTYIEANRRKDQKKWVDSDVLRIQAYQEEDSEKLHRGAEYPIRSSSDVLKLIGDLTEFYFAVRHNTD